MLVLFVAIRLLFGGSTSGHHRPRMPVPSLAKVEGRRWARGDVPRATPWRRCRSGRSSCASSFNHGSTNPGKRRQLTCASAKLRLTSASPGLDPGAHQPASRFQLLQLARQQTEGPLADLRPDSIGERRRPCRPPVGLMDWRWSKEDCRPSGKKVPRSNRRGDCFQDVVRIDNIDIDGVIGRHYVRCWDAGAQTAVGSAPVRSRSIA